MRIISTLILSLLLSSCLPEFTFNSLNSLQNLKKGKSFDSLNTFFKDYAIDTNGIEVEVDNAKYLILNYPIAYDTYRAENQFDVRERDWARIKELTARSAQDKKDAREAANNTPRKVQVTITEDFYLIFKNRMLFDFKYPFEMKVSSNKLEQKILLAINLELQKRRDEEKSK
jgi:hypothetical protein